MFLRLVLCLGAVILLAGAALTAQADIPQLINYQGVLTSGGSPVTTEVSVIFAIWNAEIDGDSLWSEEQSVTADDDGRFNVLLGAVSPIPDSAFAGAETYLSVKVDTDPEMTPRQRFASVAYAYRGASADGALYADSTDAITDGGIDFADIGPNDATENQIIKWDGVAWAAADDQTGTGGDNDWTIIDDVLYTNGEWGIARAGNVLYGDHDSTHVNLGVACTTGLSGQDHKYATVGGGMFNTASGLSATVGGGYDNTASSWSATIGGGGSNTASGQLATVGGGVLNDASGSRATVGGGMFNTASNYSTVGGGENNTASGSYATVAGGEYNTASDYSTVGGGAQNTASGELATVGGGLYNTASGHIATVSGGSGNTASGYCATVPGGRYNTAGGDYSFAAGRRAKAANVGAFVWADDNDFDFPTATESNFTPAAKMFLVRSTGGAVFVSGIDGSGNSNAGVQLAAGGGSWSSLSDRNLKENFEQVDGADVLAKIAALPISTWNYKAQDESIRHIGPMAQDVYAVFGVGEDDRHITTIDADGIALAAIQGLYQQNVDLKKRVEQLEALVKQILADQE